MSKPKAQTVCLKGHLLLHLDLLLTSALPAALSPLQTTLRNTIFAMTVLFAQSKTRIVRQIAMEEPCDSSEKTCPVLVQHGIRRLGHLRLTNLLQAPFRVCPTPCVRSPLALKQRTRQNRNIGTPKARGRESASKSQEPCKQGLNKQKQRNWLNCQPTRHDLCYSILVFYASLYRAILL